MNKNASIRGFSVIQLMFVLLVVVLLGTAGWYVYSRRDKASPVVTPSGNTMDLNLREQDEVIAAGVQSSGKYVNQKLGLEFSYPEELGEVIVLGMPSKNGQRYSIGLPKFSGEVVSYDFEPKEDDTNLGFALTEYTNCKQGGWINEAKYVHMVYEDDDLCIAGLAFADQGEGNASYMVIQKKLTRDPYRVATFTTSPVKLDDLSQKGLDDLYTATSSNDDYLAYVDRWVEAAKSIKAL